MKLYKQRKILSSIIMWTMVVIARLSFGQQPVQAATLDCSTASNINVPVQECEALLDLYDDTNGWSRTNATNWDTDTNICTWNGIGCTSAPWSSTVTRVTNIDLQSNNLVGTLPVSLSALDQIQYFYVHDNQLIWELPSERSTWTGILQFHVYDNQLIWELPSERSTWTNILEFHAGNNQLVWELPSERLTWTNMLQFFAGNNQLVWELPSERLTWTNIQYFYVHDNQLIWELPSERSTWTNIQKFEVDNNLIQGYVPDSRATNRQDRGNSRVVLSRNCIQTQWYNETTQLWIDANVDLSDQGSCSIADLSITKTANIVTAGHNHTIIYTIQYQNNGLDDATDVQIYDILGTGLVFVSASTGYTINEQYGALYGVAGDTCFASLASDTSGPYADALNQFASLEEGMSFEDLLIAGVGYEWGANRWQFWIDIIDSFFEEGSFRANMLQIGVDITDLDPSCGTLWISAIEFSLWSLASGSWWSFTLTAQVDGSQIGAWQTTILNKVTITSIDTDPVTENNKSIASVVYWNLTNPPERLIDPPKRLIIDKCPDGDRSWSYYDNVCDEPVHPAAPEDKDVPMLSEKRTATYCLYDDGDFANYIFSDVQGTRYDKAVQSLLSHCLVHWYKDIDNSFRVYDTTKRGELYKVFARMVWVTFDLNHPGKHRSYGYYEAGQKIGLWKGIDTTRDPKNAINYRDFMVVVKNYLQYMWVMSWAKNIPIAGSATITRWSFANIVSMLLSAVQTTK